jgi:hypothetical protein
VVEHQPVRDRAVRRCGKCSRSTSDHQVTSRLAFTYYPDLDDRSGALAGVGISIPLVSLTAIFGAIGAQIGRKRGLTGLGAFLGAVLGIIGVVIIAVMTATPRPAVWAPPSGRPVGG